jgi:hypothetical protein
LKKADSIEKARAMMAESLDVQKAFLERPGTAANLLNDYADTLLKCEYPELRDDQKALQIMLKVEELSKSSNPVFLDTLAWAYYLSNDQTKAIATERKALSLLAPDPPGTPARGLRAEIEQGLAEFQATRSSAKLP